MTARRRSLVVACAGWLALSAPAIAASATPVPAAFPEVPDPARCTVEPVSRDALNAAIEAEGAATPAPFREGVVPAGEPASPEQAQAALETVRTLVACYSRGELLRAYGLFTPGYFARVFGKQGAYDPAAYDGLATPMPADPDERVKILDLADVRVLPDGRVAANVVLEYAVIPMPKRFLMTFVETPDGWRIDDILGEISFSVP